jgi:hypothetical protein
MPRIALRGPRLSPCAILSREARSGFVVRAETTRRDRAARAAQGFQIRPKGTGFLISVGVAISRPGRTPWAPNEPKSDFRTLFDNMIYAKPPPTSRSAPPRTCPAPTPDVSTSSAIVTPLVGAVILPRRSASRQNKPNRRVRRMAPGENEANRAQPRIESPFLAARPGDETKPTARLAVASSGHRPAKRSQLPF